jgi:hypothetical protein
VTQDADGIKLKVDVVSLDLRALVTLRPSGVKVTLRISKSQFFFASLRSGVRRKPSPQVLVPRQIYFCLFRGQLFGLGSVSSTVGRNEDCLSKGSFQ